MIVFFSYYFTNPLDEVTFRIIEAFDAHRPVNVEEKPVIGTIVAEQFECLCHQGLIGVPRNDPTRQCTTPQRRNPVGTFSIDGARGQERIGVENLVSRSGMESLLMRPGGRKRAGFNMQPGNRDTRKLFPIVFAPLA